MKGDSSLQKQFLFWVTTLDHAENWFIVAKTSLEARTFHEEYEGYFSGEAKARKICPVPYEYYYKKEPYHAQFDLLKKLEFIVISKGSPRVVRKDGRVYREGTVTNVVMLEASDEHGSGVYIVRASGTKKFKIGIAKNFRNRFRSLQTASPEELEPYGFYPTNRERILEGYLHSFFKQNSIGREWFEFDYKEIEKVHYVALMFLEYGLNEKLRHKHRMARIKEGYEFFPELRDVKIPSSYLPLG